LGYKLYSPSLVDAQKGNFDVWFWTDLDKAPEGEITNWEPTILVHWGLILRKYIKNCLNLFPKQLLNTVLIERFFGSVGSADLCRAFLLYGESGTGAIT